MYFAFYTNAESSESKLIRTIDYYDKKLISKYPEKTCYTT